MKITRHGSSANHGKKITSTQRVVIGWSQKTKTVDLMASHVPDFNTEAKHNYVFSLDLEEIAVILQVLAEQTCTDSPQDIEDQLSKSIKSMVRLIATTSGLSTKGTTSEP